MNIVMFSAEYFPPTKMNANHKRLESLAKGLNRHHKVIIICPNNKYAYDKSEYKNITIFRFPFIPIKIIGRTIMTFRAHQYVKKILEREKIKIDILWYNAVHSFMLAKKFKCKKVYDVMGILSNETLMEKTIFNHIKALFYRKLEQELYDNSSYIITINEIHKKILAKQFHKPIYIIRDAFDYNAGIDKTSYNILKKKYKNKFILFFVGSFDRKRFERNKEAFFQLAKKESNIKIIIAGEGKFLEQYKKEFIQAETSKYFDFIGYVQGKELNSYIKISDICFSDVFLEGFPFKIFEYMAMEKVALVEETPGVKEILHDGENSLLYKNSEEFEEKVIRIKNNHALRKKIEKNAKKEFKNHTWDKREEEFNKIIEQI